MKAVEQIGIKNGLKNFCVTGGAGFIGSNFVKYLDQLKKTGTQIGVVVVYDKLTYAADLSRLEGANYILVEGDVCNTSHFTEILSKYAITHVIHFAAESHVDRSIYDDMPFILTNILGTASVLEATAQHFRQTPIANSDKMFVQISTDEVYGSILENEKAADESTRLNPSNPYAATKAASDQLVISKMNNEGFPTLILRSSNNFGRFQHNEKLIPKVIDCLSKGTPIPIYGEGRQKRCWLSAQTYSEIIWSLIEASVVNEVINVRGKEIYSNLELVELIRRKYAKMKKLEISELSRIEYVSDRKYHDFFYHIDDSKLRALNLYTGTYETLENCLDEMIVMRSVNSQR
jgi:dTDP-glucose 4,6-dehydratase